MLMVLAALILGFLVVYFIVRHWQWDEDERERGIQVGTKTTVPAGSGRVAVSAKHIDVDVDLTRETAAAFVLLFLLVGIGFSRIDQAYDLLNGSAIYRLVRAGLYVLAEVPEASPVFDATSVFRSGNLTGVPYAELLLRVSTFGLRLIYELFFVVAALRLFRVPPADRRGGRRSRNQGEAP